MQRRSLPFANVPVQRLAARPTLATVMHRPAAGVPKGTLLAKLTNGWVLVRHWSIRVLRPPPQALWRCCSETRLELGPRPLFTRQLACWVSRLFWPPSHTKQPAAKGNNRIVARKRRSMKRTDGLATLSHPLNGALSSAAGPSPDAAILLHTSEYGTKLSERRRRLRSTAWKRFAGLAVSDARRRRTASQVVGLLPMRRGYLLQTSSPFSEKCKLFDSVDQLTLATTALRN